MTDYEFFVSKSPLELGKLFKDKTSGVINVPRSRKFLQKRFSLTKDPRLKSFSITLNYTVTIKLDIFGDSVIQIDYCYDQNIFTYLIHDNKNFIGFYCIYEFKDIRNYNNFYISKVDKIRNDTKLSYIIYNLQSKRSELQPLLDTVKIWFTSVDVSELVKSENPFGSFSKTLDFQIIVDILKNISPKYTLKDIVKLTLCFKYLCIEDYNILALLGGFSNFSYDDCIYFSYSFKYPSEKDIDSLLEKYDKLRKEIDSLEKANREFYLVLDNFRHQLSEKYGVPENLISENCFDVQKDKLKNIKCINERLNDF